MTRLAQFAPCAVHSIGSLLAVSWLREAVTFPLVPRNPWKLLDAEAKSLDYRLSTVLSDRHGNMSAYSDSAYAISTANLVLQRSD